MTKTPEEMAEEYVQLAIQPHMPDKDGECYVRNYDVWSSLPNGGRIQMIFTGPPIKDAFLAGHNAAQQWISVKDRLPEMNEMCIVNTEWRGVIPATYGNESWIFDEGQGYSEKALNYASHWMPLPAPPKEEE